MSSTVRLPKKEPTLEVLILQLKRKMFHWHRAGIGPWSTDNGFPEVRYRLQVFFPVFNLDIEDRSNNRILTDVGVKVP